MRKTLKIVLIAGIVILGALEATQLYSEQTRITSGIANVLFSDNLHPVVDGKFYRSAQMSPENLRETIRKLGIQTVVDLRWGENKQAVSAEEQAVAEEGAKYVRMPLLGSRVPDKAHIQKLLNVYDESKLPILVHCSSGTHRSGVASAIWLLDKEGRPREEADEQLSAKYGFFRLERRLKSYVQGHPTIDHLIWRYDEAAEKSGVPFRDWLKQP